MISTFEKIKTAVNDSRDGNVIAVLDHLSAHDEYLIAGLSVTTVDSELMKVGLITELSAESAAEGYKYSLTLGVSTDGGLTIDEPIGTGHAFCRDDNELMKEVGKLLTVLPSRKKLTP